MTTGARTPGRRLPDGSIEEQTFAPGDYMRDEHGTWWCETPNGALGNLRNHTVEEHADGTVTVSPSILVTGQVSWHGFLRAGEWIEA